MSSPQISLAILARSAYQPANPRAGQKPSAEAKPFQPEPVRQTIKASPAVQIELSDAARAVLLGLQEVAAAPASDRRPPPASKSPGRPFTSQTYVAPGSNLNLSV